MISSAAEKGEEAIQNTGRTGPFLCYSHKHKQAPVFTPVSETRSRRRGYPNSLLNSKGPDIAIHTSCGAFSNDMCKIVIVLFPQTYSVPDTNQVTEFPTSKTTVT